MIARPRLLAAAALLAALALALGRGTREPADPCDLRPQTYPCALFGPSPTAAAPALPGADPAADGTS